MSERQVITLPQWRHLCVAACPEDRLLKIEFIVVSGDCSNVSSYGGAAKHLAPGGVLAVCGKSSEYILGHWYSQSGISDVCHHEDNTYEVYDNADSPHLTAEQKASLQKPRDERFDFVPKGIIVATVVLLLQWVGMAPKANWLVTMLAGIVAAGVFQLLAQRRSK